MVAGFRSKEIKPAKTVGQRLRSARKRRGLSLEDAERLTKVKLKYLKALEEDRHDLLPTEVYCLGFLRCYSDGLGLNTKKILQQYQSERRTFKSAKAQTHQELAPARRLIAPKLLITPKIVFLVASVAMVFTLILYIALGVRSFLAPPKLLISEPKLDSRVTSNQLEVIGQTDPAASLMINGELVSLKADGSFQRTVAVVPGLNTLEFAATNRVGKETRQTRKILAEYTIEVSPSPTVSVSPTSSPTANVTNATKDNVSPSPKATNSP